LNKKKPLLGGIEASNSIEGKLKYLKETIATIHGKWDGDIRLKEFSPSKVSEDGSQQQQNDQQQQQQQLYHCPPSSKQSTILLWTPSKENIESRLKRFVVPLNEQADFESEK
jgi:hypothetical protein